MLTITAEAAEMIRAMITSNDAHPAGLRIFENPISSDGPGPSFGYELATEPAAGDQVIVQEGAQVFVGPPPRHRWATSDSTCSRHHPASPSSRSSSNRTRPT